MNIVILCYHRIGGSGVVAYEIGRAMAEDKGHTVHFMGLEPPFRLREGNSGKGKMKFHKVLVKEYPVFDYQPYALALASQLSTIIKRCNIDVIHSHYALPHAVSAILARDISGRPVKCVTTLHGTDITVVGAHPSMIDITCYAIYKSDVTTAVSKALAQETTKKFCITHTDIRVIYNFINPKFFNPNLRTAPPREQNNKTVLVHVSNLRAVKRPLDVIKIFHGVHREMKDSVELHIVGEGPMMYEMISLAEQLGIEESVHFQGVRSDIGRVVANSDLLLLPSQQESFGLAALEAMACGVPVVASEVGGLPEVIEDGKSGFLFQLGNIDEAVEKTLKLIKDNQLYNSVQKQALKDANEKFAMNKIVDQYEQLYIK
jgi:N-acetyl-alpha-D-glucosaminyl L-malate synthase BshA